MPSDYAWDILNIVGELDALHFIDMYKDFLSAILKYLYILNN